jgi:hypothetical protein
MSEPIKDENWTYGDYPKARLKELQESVNPAPAMTAEEHRERGDRQWAQDKSWKCAFCHEIMTVTTNDAGDAKLECSEHGTLIVLSGENSSYSWVKRSEHDLVNYPPPPPGWTSKFEQTVGHWPADAEVKEQVIHQYKVKEQPSQEYKEPICTDKDVSTTDFDSYLGEKQEGSGWREREPLL